MRLKTIALGVWGMLFAAGCGAATTKPLETTPPHPAPAGASVGKDAMRTEARCGRSVATFHAIRLTPGEDLRTALTRYVHAHGIKAAAIVSAVGSLKEAVLRLADQEAHTRFVGKYEIVSLTGTLSQDGPHLHIAISDREGRTIGGHLVEGCIIYTTAEIVIVDLTDLRFSRERDPRTGYHELRIERRDRPESQN